MTALTSASAPTAGTPGPEQPADALTPALGTRQALPFVTCALLGFVVLALPPHELDPAPLVAAVLLLAGLVAAAVLLPWATWPAWTWAVPPLAYFVVLGLMREAAGGTRAGLAPLVALPVLWLALHGRRRDLAAAAVATMAAFGVPVLLEGGPDYPASDLRRALLWIGIAVLVGPAVQQVVRRLREREARLTVLGSELRAVQRQWERFGEDLPDTVVLVVDAELRYRQVSGAGRIRPQLEDWVGRTVAECSSPANTALLEPLYRAAVNGEPGTCEIFATVDSTPHQVTVVPFELHGEPAALVVARDVSEAHARELEARRSAEELRQLAEHDPLTGLVNRRTFDEVVTRHVQALADAAGRDDGATGTPRGAVLVLDVDRFKRVNDALGHHVGDRLLVSVAGLLVATLRDTDVVARLGGDEFAVLLRDADADSAPVVAQRVVDACRRHTAGVPEITGAVTASVGVRVVTDTLTSAHDLVVDADTAMYAAKRAGGDRLVVATT